MINYREIHFQQLLTENPFRSKNLLKNLKKIRYKIKPC